MTSWLRSQFGGYLLAALGAIVFAVIAMFKGRIDGAAREREKNQKAENNALRKHSKDVSDALSAGRDKRVPVDKDPRNRDN